MFLRTCWLSVMVCLCGSWWTTVNGCPPAGGPPALPPKPIEIGCLDKKRADVVNTVENSNIECLSKYAWSGGSSIEAFGATEEDYLEVFGFRQPNLTDVRIDPMCTGNVQSSDTRGYYLVLWFCLNWCERAAVQMDAVDQIHKAYPVSEVTCDKIDKADCDTPVTCKCIFRNRMAVRMQRSATVQTMINEYNRTCLTCYYQQGSCIAPGRSWANLYDNIQANQLVVN